jgi:hypothetical protein
MLKDFKKADKPVQTHIEEAAAQTDVKEAATASASAQTAATAAAEETTVFLDIAVGRA